MADVLMLRGEDGKWYPVKALTGPVGPVGPAGADGKTPVRGTDYWTPTDKTEIVNDVLAALPKWTGGAY